MADGADLRGYTAVGSDGLTLGPVVSCWAERGTGRVAFAAVRTGVLRGRTHVVPLEGATLDEERRTVRVAHPRALVLDAPSHPEGSPLDAALARDLMAHYRRPPEGARIGDDAALQEIALHQERVDVGKRVVRAGGVRLRKVVRREVVHVPVEVLREEIVVERVGPEAMPADAAVTRLPDAPFEEGEAFIPVLAEEPLVGKTTEVVGGVRAHKVVETREEVVRAEARHEDVEVDRLPP